MVRSNCEQGCQNWDPT